MEHDKALVRGAIKFTDRALKALLPPADGRKDYLKFDSEEPGLAVRVGRRGSKTLFFQRLVDGRRARIPIGAWPSTCLADARKAAHAHSHRLNQGVDVGAEHRAKRKRGAAIARGEAKTLKSAVAGFVEENPHEAGEGHLGKTWRIMSRVFGEILERPFDELSVDDFKACLKAVKGRSARHVAGARATAVCRWAAAEFKMADPLAGQKKKLPKAPPSREAFLSGEDMRKVFHATGTMPAPAGPLIQFMMLTALRRNEAACTKWGEFDDYRTKLEVPSGRMKGGERAHRHWVPLAPQLGELLAALERHEGSDLVFTYTGKRPPLGFHRFKLQLDKALKEAGVSVPSFRFHDFRRSFVAWAQERNEAFPFDAADVADRCLGHETFNKVKRTYNPYTFQKERRELLAAWANYLITGALPRKANAPDIVDVKFEEVQPRQLPRPKAEEGDGEREEAFGKDRVIEACAWPRVDGPIAELKWGDFPVELWPGRMAYDWLLRIATQPGVSTAIANILRRGESAYTQRFRKQFREKVPFPLSDAAIGVARFLLHGAAMKALRLIGDRLGSEDIPSKLELTKRFAKEIKAELDEIYNRDTDTIAAAVANAAYNAALTRWPLRGWKGGGSNLEPIPVPEAPAKTAA
jgi:integrase